MLQKSSNKAESGCLWESEGLGASLFHKVVYRTSPLQLSTYTSLVKIKTMSKGPTLLNQ